MVLRRRERLAVWRRGSSFWSSCRSSESFPGQMRQGGRLGGSIVLFCLLVVTNPLELRSGGWKREGAISDAHDRRRCCRCCLAVSRLGDRGHPWRLRERSITMCKALDLHLHHEIREKGGAYGGGAYSRALDGLFGFYSYRDPNPQNTLSIMRGAGQWAADKSWVDRDLEEAKLSIFQSVDAPRSVNEEGMGRFLSGITDEMKQTRREQLLDVTKEQVRAVAQKYLVDGLKKEEERVAFLGEKRAWVDGSWKVQEMDIQGAEELN
ncbi:hypothetical protein BN1708_012208 [Verticillium longisporum]|uniref:Presequence protease mitochondrial-type C-terminal domain-containing protein n=1 Tax=Verticillium longisporum TaxID=100787 RepID=A0A0G4L7N6_VERLO|nr:hypothetical protein BN1708_012208 [Verticillium longisporum]